MHTLLPGLFKMSILRTPSGQALFSFLKQLFPTFSSPPQRSTTAPTDELNPDCHVPDVLSKCIMVIVFFAVKLGQGIATVSSTNNSTIKCLFHVIKFC